MAWWSGLFALLTAITRVDLSRLETSNQTMEMSDQLGLCDHTLPPTRLPTPYQGMNASSYYGWSWNADKAGDGSMDTMWMSVSKFEIVGQWIEVLLPAVYEIHSVTLSTSDYPCSRASIWRVELQLEDRVTLSTFDLEGDCDAGVGLTLAAAGEGEVLGTARYVRATVLEACPLCQATGNAAEVKEFDIYGRNCT